MRLIARAVYYKQKIVSWWFKKTVNALVLVLLQKLVTRLTDCALCWLQYTKPNQLLKKSHKRNNHTTQQNLPIFGEIEVKDSAVTLMRGGVQRIPDLHALKFGVQLAWYWPQVHTSWTVRELTKWPLVQPMVQRLWLRHDERLGNLNKTSNTVFTQLPKQGRAHYGHKPHLRTEYTKLQQQWHTCLLYTTRTSSTSVDFNILLRKGAKHAHFYQARVQTMFSICDFLYGSPTVGVT